MSKELYFTDGNNEVKYLDTTASFNLAITQDGSAFDLTNATAIDVKVANDTGYVFDKSIDMTTITQPLAGLITMPVDAEVMNALVPDDYTIEVWVTLSSLITPGSQEGLTDTSTDGTTTDTTTSTTDTTTYNAIFPSDDPQGFTITDNVMSDSGDVIPVMSLDDFQQEFDQLKTDLTNQVSTLQGPKGDTGQGLEIKGKVDTTSQLPATASEGDGYLVNEELYVYTSGAWKDCGPIQGPQGIQGIQGKTGNGISSTNIQYQISNSPTTAPTGTWSNSIVATTTANPHLWMKATLNYTDGTTKDFYLVSQKGDKGDKGDTGDIGPVGPVGPVGAGLVVKGTVNDASQLPTTGNQEGYCYFVGTDLYVWDAGKWKNCGSVSPDLSNYVTVTDLNNGLSTKVTDNKDGTEQLNGTKVQPFNKLSDSVGGRNLLIGTSDFTGWNLSGSTAQGTTDGLTYAHLFVDVSLVAPNFTLAESTTYTVSFDALGYSAETTQIYIGYSKDSNGNIIASDYANATVNALDGASVRVSLTFTTPSSFTKTNFNIGCGRNYKTGGSFYIRHIKLEKGSIATAWTPAPEDKVNVSDMRKPASDVAGIEEVNAKQDKIGYTPADDSKVVHNTGTEEIAGQKTFDVAPIDKTTGNPYITKDGVPTVDLSNYAKTSDVSSAISTATANMVDSSKPTNFTDGLQSGGVDVATAADIKSIEDSAWRKVTNSAFNGSYLFRDNQDGTATLSGTIYYSAPTQTYNGYPDFAIPLPTGYSAKGDVYDWDKAYTIMRIRDTEDDDSIIKSYYPGSAMHLFTYGNYSLKDAIISLYSPILPIFNSSSYTDAQKVGFADGFTVKITKS